MNNKEAHLEHIRSQKDLASYNNYTNGHISRQAKNLDVKIKESGFVKFKRSPPFKIGDIAPESHWNAIKRLCK